MLRIVLSLLIFAVLRPFQLGAGSVTEAADFCLHGEEPCM